MFIPALLLLQGSIQSCNFTSTRQTFDSVKQYCVQPQDRGDDGDVLWSEYLYSHLSKRLADRSRITTSSTSDGYKVYVDIDASISCDYSVTCLKDGICLQARSKESMTWLLYQFIAAAGHDDKAIEVSDLPPASIHMENQSGNFAFDYRGIYSPNNTDTDLMGILASHNVDYDWGLWGHNLHKTLSNASLSELYAKVDGRTERSQYCFSSDELYKQVEAYIIDNYGDGRKVSERFAILPNDNDVVCLCPACKAKGNVEGNATPASAAFIERLAKRFPKHRFFMSAYSTTTTPPKTKMPDNVGVIVSSMDLPMVMTNTENAVTKQFTSLLQNWKQNVNNVYIWEYMRNFDDYYTPFPCLKILQSRLQYYQAQGVKGIFLNGSGYDYATFDDVQTYVLASLLLNPQANVDELTDKYFAQNYPTSSNEIGAFYKALENKASASKSDLQFYGGIQDAVNCYLDTDAFTDFYNNLPSLINKAASTETEKLRRIYTALSFTRLDLARIPGQNGVSRSDASKWLTQLLQYAAYKDMKNNREAYADLPDYIESWTQRLKAQKSANPLTSLNVKTWGAKDVAGNTAKILTDGDYGFSCDYHTGWVISKTDEWGLELPEEVARKGGVFTLSFLQAPVWKLYAPQSIKLYADNQLIATKLVAVGNSEDAYRNVKVTVNVPSTQAKTLRIAIVRPSNARAKVACDEIYWQQR